MVQDMTESLDSWFLARLSHAMPEQGLLCPLLRYSQLRGLGCQCSAAVGLASIHISSVRLRLFYDILPLTRL